MRRFCWKRYWIKVKEYLYVRVRDCVSGFSIKYRGIL